jgi:hypothetical protein
MKFLAAATKNRPGLEFRLFLKQNAAFSSGLLQHNAAKRQDGDTGLAINQWLYLFLFLI